MGIQRLINKHVNRIKKATVSPAQSHFVIENLSSQKVQHLTKISIPEYETAYEAIQREKTIKKWRRARKEALIASLNPHWRFLNDSFWEG
jgi:predicted GIY-YIG superfamily endonuclease